MNLTRPLIQPLAFAEEMQEKFPKGTRVRFLRDFDAGCGNIVREGTTGVGRGGSTGVIVTLDGWEQEKAADEARWRTRGEGANIVPWIVTAPHSVLERLG